MKCKNCEKPLEKENFFDTGRCPDTEPFTEKEKQDRNSFSEPKYCGMSKGDD